MASIIPFGKHKSEEIVDATLVEVAPKITFLRRGGKVVRKVNPSEPIHFYRMTDAGIHIPFALKNKFNTINNNEKEVFNRPPTKKKLRSNQKEIFLTALNNLRNKDSVLLNLPTGYGKTYLSIQLWSLMERTGVILVNRISLVDQWKQNILDCFDNINIFVVGEDKLELFGEEFSTSKRKTKITPFNKDIPTIIICMAGRADTLPIDIRKRVGTVIIDEAHLFCSPSHIQSLLWFFPTKLIACSATPSRTDGAHTMLSMLIPEKNHIVVVPTLPFEVHIIPTYLELIGLDYATKYEYAYQSDSRNNIICGIAKKCYEKDNKCMILTNRVEHVDTIHSIIEKDIGGDVQKYYMTQSSCDNYRVMVGTIPKVGTGFDESMACQDFDGDCSNVLILCCTIKNESTFIQVIGRVMRAKNPKIFLLEDSDQMPKNHIRGLIPLIEGRCGRVFRHKNHNNVEFVL